MGIHIGKKIKEEVYRQGMSVIQFAKKINRSRNVVYDIFERESIDTALLNKIGKTLNCDFFSLYSSRDYNSPDVKSYTLGDQPPAYGKQADEVKALQKQNEALLTEIAYLKKIIALLEKGKKPK